MACYRPISGYRGRGGAIVFKRSEAVILQEMQVPCGQCIGCRLERSRQWAARCVHEAALYEENSFITLTYEDARLPIGGSLVLHHWQDFMKRLRSRLAPRRIRFFHCGEYGDRFNRPHYHAIIFNFGFPDRVYFKKTGSGERLYISAFLDSLWSYGFSTVGDCTFDSAAYCARYCVKKVNGEAAYDHYWRVDERTGECHQVEPEYCTMSRRPGIGAGWLEKFESDVFPCDELPIPGRGVFGKPPRFYDARYEIGHPEVFAEIKKARVRRARVHRADQTAERLRVREKVKVAQVSLLKRGYEGES